MEQGKSKSPELGVMYFNTRPEVCEYQKSICPSNIPKYSMKCVFNKRSCRIRRYFKRYEGLDLTKLGVGSLK